MHIFKSSEKNIDDEMHIRGIIYKMEMDDSHTLNLL